MVKAFAFEPGDLLPSSLRVFGFHLDRGLGDNSAMGTFIARIDELIIPFLRRWGVPTLRISLAIVFIWFGALKVLGVSPVVDLVASTVYWVDPDWFVPALGVVEILVGLGLAARRWLRLVLLVLAGQMVGTFLVFVLLREIAFQDGNPLKLTVEGEFVIKNLVLLAAGMVVGASIGRSEVVVPLPTEQVGAGGRS
jgi:uncharacterized membrane protein YkgB